MYDEWAISPTSNVRFVISGYEDGGSADFYHLNNGKYEHIVEVHPIVKDKEGTYWWGYADTLKALPFDEKEGHIRVWATFAHDQCDDGNHPHPKWQAQVPVVLFEGEKARWNVEQPTYEYRLMTLEELAVEAAKANRTFRPTEPRCGRLRD